MVQYNSCSQISLQPGMEPPIHMPVAYGPVKPTRVKPGESQESEEVEIEEMCFICQETIKKTDIMRYVFPLTEMTLTLLHLITVLYIEIHYSIACVQ